MVAVDVELGSDFVRSSALGRLALVERNLACPDRRGVYRGEIVVAEEARNFCIDLLFAGGNVAKRFETARAASGERVLFSWDGRLNGRSIDHQLLRVTTHGVRATMFVWATVAAVRIDNPMCNPIFCTAIGEFQGSDIVRISNEAGFWQGDAASRATGA